MNKSAILKLAGLIIVPFIIMVVGIFFLYPKINKEEYNDLVSEFEQEQEELLQSQTGISSSNVKEYDPSMFQPASVSGLDDSSAAMTAKARGLELPDSLMVIDREELLLKLETYENTELRLHGVIDSLYTEIENLQKQMNSVEEDTEQEEEMDPVEFTERVKSLLNLDEEEMGPILEQMSNEEIERLYFGGGTIQRQKILRSLEAKRAAELMKGIMK